MPSHRGMKMTARHSTLSTPARPQAAMRYVLPLLILSGLTLGLSSCATGTRPTRAATPPSPPPPGVAVSLKQRCPQLPAAPSSQALAILQQHDLEASMYRDCSDGKARLIEATQEWEATAWRWYCQAVAGMDLTVKDCPRD